MEFTPPLRILVRQSLKRYATLSLITTGLVILVRIYEILFIAAKAGYPPGSTLDLIFGIRFDLMFSLRLSVYLLLPYLVTDHFSHKTARVFYAIFSIAAVLTDVALLHYFSTTRIPLGSDVFGYSFDEIKHTVQASGEMNPYTILPFFSFIAISIYTFYKLSEKRISSFLSILVIAALFFTLLPFNTINPYPTEFKNEFRKNITSNKFNLFSESLQEYYHAKNIPTDFVLNENVNVTEDIMQDQVQLTELSRPLIDTTHQLKNQDKPLIERDNPLSTSDKVEKVKDLPLSSQPSDPGNPHTYLSRDYPFLHPERTPDVLDPFFKAWAEPPSVVFIIVESLGRAYSGNGAYLGSFTPFLDSLMSKGLYWENCLSTSGRTFSVLPSLLASLPFGEKGFNNLGIKMPDHLSLLSLLKNRAGYATSFYYGGDPEFDQMGNFMLHQGIGKIIGEKEFGAEYHKLPASSQGFSWGYGDHEIFRKYLDDLKSRESGQRADVILTIATHNPFLVPDQQYYNDLFEKRMNDTGLTESQKKFNRQYRAQFATILYFDESLRYFFKEFSKLKSFGNTIFVITGDHRMPEIPINTLLDRFHVPLVIYSPLLKQGQRFSSIVTHFDVTPSLLALFKERMNIQLPAVTSWIGHGLDTNTGFRNLHAYPLKRNTGELTDYINGTHFVAGTTLYKVFPDLNIEPEQDPAQLDQLQRKFLNFKSRNLFATKGNHLIPDSLKKYLVP
ncbi:MAG: LTA synthase family protein [Prolixibacteraceae bacterium]